MTVVSQKIFRLALILCCLGLLILVNNPIHAGSRKKGEIEVSNSTNLTIFLTGQERYCMDWVGSGSVSPNSSTIIRADGDKDGSCVRKQKGFTIFIHDVSEYTRVCHETYTWYCTHTFSPLVGVNMELNQGEHAEGVSGFEEKYLTVYKSKASGYQHQVIKRGTHVKLGNNQYNTKTGTDIMSVTFTYKGKKYYVYGIWMYSEYGNIFRIQILNKKIPY